MIGALAIGFLGSFHCVGMCGPIMMAFMGPRQSKMGFLTYHAGRILTYVLIGAVFGLIGASFRLFQFQQIVTFVLGVMLLLLYGIPSMRHALERTYYESTFYRYLKGFLGRNLSTRKRWFLSGVANGLFPCGLTYIALAGAIALGDVFQGALFMIMFGLGTLPALVLVSFTTESIALRFKHLIPRTTSFIAMVSGMILILRALLISFPDFNQMVQANAATLITVCGL